MITNAVMLLGLMTGPAAPLTPTALPLGERAPSWATDYWQARTLAKSQNKPLAVVIGTGANGQARIARDGQLSTRIQSVLAEQYVAVYVDASQPDGKSLAQQLGIKSGVGLVISDRSTDYQAFNHDGSLSEAELVQQLQQPRTTVRTSYYQPTTVNGGFSSAPSIRMRGC